MINGIFVEDDVFMQLKKQNINVISRFGVGGKSKIYKAIYNEEIVALKIMKTVKIEEGKNNLNEEGEIIKNEIATLEQLKVLKCENAVRLVEYLKINEYYVLVTFKPLTFYYLLRCWSLPIRIPSTI